MKDFRIEDMTEEEAELLQLKIAIKESYIKLEDLQNKYLKLTGKRFVWFKL